MSEKNDIRFLARSEEYQKAYKMLFKLYNRDIDDLYDRNFILYTLSKVCKKLNRYDEAKKYINLALYDIENIDGYSTEKIKSMWLYLELNKDSLSNEEINSRYESLKSSINDSLENEELYLGLECSIYFLNKDNTKIVEIFYMCLERHYIDIIESILFESKEVDKLLFYKLSKIYEMYEIKREEKI